MFQPSEVQQNQIEGDSSWEAELGRSLRTADDLVRSSLLSKEDAARYAPLLHRYKFLLPRYYARLIDLSNAHCPIRRQAVPSLEELESGARWLQDPLHDREHQPVRRITHRYPNRLLLHLTSNCSMYCRFCFRKSLLNELKADLFGGDLGAALGYIASHPKVEEVIFSGGDPLMASDLTLRTLLRQLEPMAHLRRVRFHTRVPVTFPMRVTESLASLLAEHRMRAVVVTHFNHPREITPESTLACARLRETGITLLNQSVLLKHVNDDAKTLAALSRALFDIGVLPYYLHHPDRAEGTSHFDIDPKDGLRIHDELRRDLSGYLVPRYVIDVVGRPSKTPVSDFVSETQNGIN